MVFVRRTKKASGQGGIHLTCLQDKIEGRKQNGSRSEFGFILLLDQMINEA